MRGMILAAGLGSRMRHLTQSTPKPLLRVGRRYLIEYAIYNFLQAGIHEIVINISHHADQIKNALGDGSRYAASFFYSEEKERLETGGGILQALPLLGNKPFIVMSCDIITDYPLVKLIDHPLKGLAHLVMVDNPIYHPQGDFALQGDRLTATSNVNSLLTVGNITLYDPKLFAGCQPGHFKVTQLWLPAIANGQITGEHYRGTWFNIGTPEDLAACALDNNVSLASSHK